MTLNNISKKMSKSIPNGCIFLTDTEEIIIEKVKKAQTDEFLFPITLEDLYNRQAAYNLANILSIIEDISLEGIIKTYGNYTWKDFKMILSNALIKFTQHFQNNYNHITDEEIEYMLHENHQIINNIVNNNLKNLYEIYM